MEYQEKPRKDTEENMADSPDTTAQGRENTAGENSGEGFSFMQETIKNENSGSGKSRNTVLKYAGLGLIFGLAACLGFYALKPWAENHFAGNPQKVTIPEEEEEQVQEGEAQQQEEEVPELTLEDYEKMNQALVTVANDVNRSMVEISVRTQTPGEEDTSIAGVIFEDNGTELLVAGQSFSVPEGGTLQAVLADNNTYNIRMKKQDTNLGIAVYAIQKSEIPDSAWNQIRTAVLGSSGGMTKGTVVLAVGSPFGYYGGMGFGVVSSSRNVASRYDGEYGLLCTDIGSSGKGSGILANTKGEIVGLIHQDLMDEEEAGPVTAYGISDLKEALELLSNDQTVPYIGIHGVTVTEDLTNSQGIPSGVYVREVGPDSPAMTAGIQSGDVLTDINGTKITTLSGYNSALMKLGEGQEIRVKGQRQGTGGYVEISFKVTVGGKD